MKTIDINDWEISGGGSAGVSYTNKNNPDLLLKIENRAVSPEELEKQLQTARIVCKLGILTPDPGEVVFDGQRYGITFKRIADKISFARLLGEHPEMIAQLAHEYATIVKSMHSTVAKGSGLRSIKETYGEMIMANPFRPKKLIDKVMALLQSLPDADTCVHGDLHFGNIIKASGQNYVIDISTFSYGHPYFDLAMMASIHELGRTDPKMHRHLFHHDAAISDQFWDLFIREYFSADMTMESLKELLAPYITVRRLTMETETGHPLPFFDID